MKVTYKKQLVMTIAVMLCLTFISVSAQAIVYPGVFFYSDAAFSDLIIKANITVGETYPIRMKWFPEFTHEGYKIEIKDSNDKVVWTASNTWTNTGIAAKYMTVNWNTSGFKQGEYTLVLTPTFYVRYQWNEAPVTRILWISLTNAAPKTYTGWKQENGKWYYYINNTKQTGWLKTGDWYYFNNKGVMQTGWLVLNGTKYYLDSSGAMVTGWSQINNNWYYFDTTGSMHTGWLELKEGNTSTWYWLDKNGVMVTGWQLINGIWEMFADSGAWLYTWSGN